jgi:hypothetical protein
MQKAEEEAEGAGDEENEVDGAEGEKEASNEAENIEEPSPCMPEATADASETIEGSEV